jgi:hypothetical protein
MSAGSAGSAASRPWLRWAVLAVALVLGTWLRLRELAALPLHGDEYHTLAAADSAYGAILGTFDDVGSHVALPLLQRLALDVFGDGIVPFRLVAIVPGLLFLVPWVEVSRSFCCREINPLFESVILKALIRFPRKSQVIKSPCHASGK